MKKLIAILAGAALLIGAASCTKADQFDGTTWERTETTTLLGAQVTIVSTISFASPNFTWKIGDITTTGTYTADKNNVTLTYTVNNNSVSVSGTKDKKTLTIEGDVYTKK